MAAVVVPGGDHPTMALDEELEELRRALGERIETLVYSWSDDPRAPLRVEHVGDGRRSR